MSDQSTLIAATCQQSASGFYFIAKDGGGVQKWPAVILDNYNDLKRDSNGQLLCLIEVKTRDGNFVVDTHQEPARQAGSFDFYHEGDLSV